ncbi:MAG: hypothetical protein HQL98_08570 [Magnetococcales bacterium]|nr:hypothetical protein [Magnetococcales bacterium]
MKPWHAWGATLVSLLLSGAAGPARADVAIFVHGYLSGDDAWEQSGVTPALKTKGWESGGSVTAMAQGGLQFRNTPPKGAHAFFLADLPSEAPLLTQANALKEILLAIRAQRGTERTFLIGHSAGGVVARLLMVREPGLSIHTLITIASPHLGTDKAEVAGLIASTPLSMMAPMMGMDTLNRSKSLYEDLARERPGTFLHWLNHQPHPKARYLSIVRRDTPSLLGDNLVPVWSQDMAQVTALRTLTPETITQGQDHTLTPQDGAEVARILAP